MRMTAIIYCMVIVTTTTTAFRNFVKRNLSTPTPSRRLSSRAAGQSTMFSSIQFDNANLRKLPLDESPFTPGDSRQVPNCIFSPVALQPVRNPVLICQSDAALGLLGIAPAASLSAQATQARELALYLGGNELIPGSNPAAHCYCGHQFGSFAGQLGDGAAMYLGEVINPATGQRWELQLKGAGTTPFSRSSDGRKVVRSSIREFLASEAMHMLGVPTTRAGSVVTSDSTVQRDPFYDGRVLNERCTIVSRIAPNFFRFGSFEIFKQGRGGERSGPSPGNNALKRQLLDHIITTYFPAIAGSAGSAAPSASSPAPLSSEHYKQFLLEIVRATATLCAQWQGFGFVHGVLNTDNMSIMGLTIDYGPYAFLEFFDADFTPNGSDGSGRYTYERQPEMCKWNLGKLAEALAPMVSLADSAALLQQYDAMYLSKYREIMTAKLGLGAWRAGDDGLLDGFFASMSAAQTDFTDAFRALTAFQASLPGTSDQALAKAALVDVLASRSASPTDLQGMMKRKLRIHRLNMKPEQIESLLAILEEGPAVVAEYFGGADVAAIKEELLGEKKKLDRLVFASSEIKRLESTSPGSKAARDREAWEGWVEKYHSRVQHEPAASADARLAAMSAANPTFILRNWVIQEAIEAAEGSPADFSKVATLLRMSSSPFEPAFCTMTPAYEAALGGACRGGNQGRTLSAEEKAFLRAPPAWAAALLCTCSS